MNLNAECILLSRLHLLGYYINGNSQWLLIEYI